MIKRDELTDPNSCMSRARDDEMVFVLIATDQDAPDTIRDWIARKIERGKSPDDPKLVDAERCARLMVAQRASRESREVNA